MSDFTQDELRQITRLTTYYLSQQINSDSNFDDTLLLRDKTCQLLEKVIETNIDRIQHDKALAVSLMKTYLTEYNVMEDEFREVLNGMYKHIHELGEDNK